MKKIRVRPLHREVASQLREMIRKGVLTKGQRIVEAELCGATGVSRTPLREALRVLSAEGLVRVVPNKGAYVSQPSMDEIKDMFQVMGVLEGTCARIASERMTDGQLRRLERLHQKLEEHFEAEDREGYIKANNDYHTLVQEITGNKVLNEIINGLREKVLLYRFRQLSGEKRLSESIQEHRNILDAFRRRDADAAEARMRDHLLRQCQALVSLHEAEERAVTKR